MNDIGQIERLLRAGVPAAPDAAARAARRFADAAADAADVAYTVADSPLGPLALAVTRRGLVRVAYLDDSLDAILEELAVKVSPRVLEAPRRLDEPRRQLDEYFAGRRRVFELSIDWSLEHGFTERVLRATAAIPPGQVASYGEVATRAGSSRAVRAAGNALGSNSKPIVVPCHRVVRTGGALGGYTGGVERKRFLLGLEGRNYEAVS
jgi:methylated-DNA-[protein]-cysteine S-methyltransferase